MQYIVLYFLIKKKKGTWQPAPGNSYSLKLFHEIFFWFIGESQEKNIICIKF